MSARPGRTSTGHPGRLQPHGHQHEAGTDRSAGRARGVAGAGCHPATARRARRRSTSSSRPKRRGASARPIGNPTADRGGHDRQRADHARASRLTRAGRRASAVASPQPRRHRGHTADAPPRWRRVCRRCSPRAKRRRPASRLRTTCAASNRAPRGPDRPTPGDRRSHRPRRHVVDVHGVPEQCRKALDDAPQVTGRCLRG